MDWIDETENEDRWLSLVNAIMNLQVPLSTGECLGELRNYSIFKKDSTPRK
jgi:hypothetical protein